MTYNGNLEEICINCEGSFILNKYKNQCYNILTYHLIEGKVPPSINNRIELVKNYIIDPIPDITNLLKSNKDLSFINGKFSYIQQALHDINMIANKYDIVNVTLWLAKGDHFFFYCDELLDSSDGNAFDPLGMNRLCGLKTM